MKKILLPLLIVCTHQIKAQTTSICFSSAVGNAISSSPMSICNADFNNDGFIDLATANNNANNVSVLLGNGTANFNPGNTYSTGTGTAPYYICAADFNGDGFTDLATANNNTSNMSILLGTGTGAFGAATQFGMGPNPTDIKSADFNGDGKADIVTSNGSANYIAVRLGNGSGGFGSSSTYPTGTQPDALTIADFNGDGNKDIAVAANSANKISVIAVKIIFF